MQRQQRAGARQCRPAGDGATRRRAIHASVVPSVPIGAGHRRAAPPARRRPRDRPDAQRRHQRLRGPDPLQARPEGSGDSDPENNVASSRHAADRIAKKTRPKRRRAVRNISCSSSGVRLAARAVVERRRFDAHVDPRGRGGGRRGQNAATRRRAGPGCRVRLEGIGCVRVEPYQSRRGGHGSGTYPSMPGEPGRKGSGHRRRNGKDGRTAPLPGWRVAYLSNARVRRMGHRRGGGGRPDPAGLSGRACPAKRWPARSTPSIAPA